MGSLAKSEIPLPAPESSPLAEFSGYRLVDWVEEIYPVLKGKSNPAELALIRDAVIDSNSKSLIDLGIGGGGDLATVLNQLDRCDHKLSRVEAIDIDLRMKLRARSNLLAHGKRVQIQSVDWHSKEQLSPLSQTPFDFAFLLGNALSQVEGSQVEGSHVEGPTNTSGLSQQRIVMQHFANLIRPGGYLFFDTRNFERIHSMRELSPFERLSSTWSVLEGSTYHGTDEVFVFPRDVQDSTVVLDYYYPEGRVWSQMSVHPIYRSNIPQLLGPEFVLEKVFYDYQDTENPNAQFFQFLARRL